MTTTTNKINGRVDGNIETFTKGTYNGIAILIRDKDGYVNAAKLGNDKKEARKFVNSDKFNEICKKWMKIRCAQKGADPEMTPKYRLLNVSNEFKGTYIHPKLVHFVAEWVDLEYAFTVSEIMDSINDKVHEELNNKQLPDNVENAKPIFNEIAKSIAPNIQINNSSTWGYRDSPYELDSWEQDDLKRAVDEYKDIKERLLKAEQKIDEWSVFVRKYHPEFQK